MLEPFVSWVQKYKKLPYLATFEGIFIKNKEKGKMGTCFWQATSSMTE